MRASRIAEWQGAGGGFLRSIRLEASAEAVSHYPFDLPVLAALRARGELTMDSAVTLFTGDNGTGKSTLIEAIAVAAGYNPEGGSKSFRLPCTPTSRSSCKTSPSGP
jgi:predicted ATPase